MSDSPEVGRVDEWHEAPSVTITRLLCQFALSVGVLLVGLWLLLAHPEYGGEAALLTGLVVGAWFGIVREPIWGRKRR